MDNTADEAYWRHSCVAHVTTASVTATSEGTSILLTGQAQTKCSLGWAHMPDLSLLLFRCYGDLIDCSLEAAPDLDRPCLKMGWVIAYYTMQGIIDPAEHHAMKSSY
eukprot:2167297-Amphidinium_carterae.1